MKKLHSQYLAGLNLFQDISDSDRSFLASQFELCTFPKDKFLFERGEPRGPFWIILEGKLEILDVSGAVESQVAVCSEGTVLGEYTLMEKGLYNTSGRSITEVRLACFSEEAIENLKHQKVRLFAELLITSSKLRSRRLANAGRGGRGRGSIFGEGDERIEHDLLGDRAVPANVLWGVQTSRAVENFSISGVRLDSFPEMIESLAVIKKASAIVNCELGTLEQGHCDLIVQVCEELIDGFWHGHFVVDMVQGGAGTSTNMNANEVIANRALELAGQEKGNYDYLHPNTHVNMSQSTNDVYPSALKLSLLKMSTALLAELDLLVDAFLKKEKEFSDVLKMGRTQLQDAVPMTLGQEFGAWGRNLREGRRRIKHSLSYLQSLNLGGTAIGTGINTDARFPDMVIAELQKLLDFDVQNAPDLVEETQDTSGFVELSGVLKMMAVRLSKICNDLRLLSSGPRCGFNEINLPAVQPGSSIMPGKVNPVIPEVVNQVAFQIIGLDSSISMAAEAGQLELNVFEPLIAYNLFSSIKMLASAAETLRVRCIDGITANVDRCRDLVLNSIGIVTALNPHLGYEKTSIIAQEALKTGRPVAEIVLERGFMNAELLEKVLSPEAMTRPTLRLTKKT